MIGPNAKPKINRLVPRIITSLGTWKCFAVAIVAVLKIDEPTVTANVIIPSVTVITHLRVEEKLRGFSY